MKFLSFFSASPLQALTTSSLLSNDLLPSEIVVPKLPSQEMPKITVPVVVFSQSSQLRF